MQSEELEGIPSQEKSAVEKPHFVLSQKAKKIILIGGGVLFFLLMLLLVVIGQTAKAPARRIIPIVTPAYFVVTTTPTPPPTKWASDSGILKIKTDLSSLGKNITTVDLSEPMLELPNIDLRVTFQK